jgi:hypothetical protein
MVGAVLGLLGLVLIIPACAQHAAEISFKGRCTDPSGRGINAFSFSISRDVSGAEQQPITVQTQDGNYQFRVRIATLSGKTPPPGEKGRRTLGPSTDTITIRVAAKGYKSKTFKVPADQVFVGEPNTLNVVLEPTSQ